MSQVPENLKYSKDHEWVRVEGTKAYIGVTYFAQEELGDIVFVELPEPGTKLSVDETFGTVESVKTVSDMFAPVSGEVVEINQELVDNPEFVNESPYEKGWMVAIEMSNPDELNQLLDSQTYEQHVSEA